MTSRNSKQRSPRRPAHQTVAPNILTARVRTKVWLEAGGRFVMGDGGLRLLEGVARLGSLAGAVRDIGWSYRHAWGYVRHAETVLGAPLLVPRPGKGRQRGAVLTEHGRQLLLRLRAARAQVDAALGDSGPTLDEIASRGGLGAAPGRRRVTPAAAAGSPSAPS
jgi:molybdate transport system regulatory protein